MKREQEIQVGEESRQKQLMMMEYFYLIAKEMYLRYVWRSLRSKTGGDDDEDTGFSPNVYSAIYKCDLVKDGCLSGHLEALLRNAHFNSLLFEPDVEEEAVIALMEQQASATGGLRLSTDADRIGGTLVDLDYLWIIWAELGPVLGLCFNDSQWAAHLVYDTEKDLGNWNAHLMFISHLHLNEPIPVEF